ncbi:MAG: MATE family efflux transporter [Lachnospiraceae bacterium]|jgi:Na+-driven multidrug efflux pump
MNSLAGKISNKTSTRRLIAMISAIAFPVALQNLLTTTGSMIDTIMIASLGEQSVGAVGLCAQYSSLMFSGYWGFVGGGMLFFSQFYGAGDHDNIRRSFGMTLVFMMISGVTFGSFAVFAPLSVMRLYTDSEAIQQIGASYIHLVGFAYPLQVIAMAQSALLRSTEHVHIPLIGGICALLTNCTVNYILIFGHLGFPAMGVAGAAVGTIMSCIVNIAVIVILVKIRHVPYVLDFSMHFRWNKTLLKQYLIKSAPIIANEVLIGIGNMMINIVLGHQAEYAIAATAVFRTLEGIVIAFFSGFSNAATVLIGKEIGAGNHEESWSRAYRLVYLCQLLTLGACLLLISIHRPLLHVMGLSGDSFSTAFGMLLIFTVAACIRMGNWCMNDTYRAGGDPAFGSTLEIVFMFAMVQPAIHLANDVFHWPFLVVFALCYCDEPIRYIIMQIHMYSGKWIRPVSGPGKEAIDAFRSKYGIVMKEKA